MLIRLLVAMALVSVATAEESKWVSLFDGKTLEGWTSSNGGKPGKGWEVVDGSIHRAAKSGDLISAEEFDDFELEFEWRVSPGVNSGLKYRVRKTPAGWIGPEYQILDDAKHSNGKNPKTSASAMYVMFPASESKALAPVGEWNRSKIVVSGKKLEHWLNGKLVVAAEVGSEAWAAAKKSSKFAKIEGYGEPGPGKILLQDHGGEVWFRSLRIRAL
ncbi:glycosyl hydrolase [Haloferula helveola]|uniref:Glycosyl hydrolase n=1 Tax=Haloferula helveola TaxID=490095 RepID=A0ABM7RAG4_9BACT|nr:glycosyl hydrolase [Haloferula helveola]